MNLENTDAQEASGFATPEPADIEHELSELLEALPSAEELFPELEGIHARTEAELQELLESLSLPERELKQPEEQQPMNNTYQPQPEQQQESRTQLERVAPLTLRLIAGGQSAFHNDDLRFERLCLALTLLEMEAEQPESISEDVQPVLGSIAVALRTIEQRSAEPIREEPLPDLGFACRVFAYHCQQKRVPFTRGHWAGVFSDYVYGRWIDSKGWQPGPQAGNPELVLLIMTCKAHGIFDLCDPLTLSYWLDYLNEHPGRLQTWHAWEAEQGKQSALYWDNAIGARYEREQQEASS